MDLGWLAGGHYAVPTAIANGWIVGVSATADGSQHAFLWKGGKMKDLGMPAGYGGSQASALQPKVPGVIVGFSTDADGLEHATRFEAGQAPVLLENEVSNLGDWALYFAYGVNASGVITGFGASGGHTHGFLLMPQ